MNILIINQPPFNRGDESAHKALVRTLLKKIPNLNIRVLSRIEWKESLRQYAIEDKSVSYVYEPVDYYKFYGFCHRCLKKGHKWMIRLHPFSRMYKEHYVWADVVLCAPGGICMGAFQDWHHLFLLHLAKLYHKPLAYYGRSFGPFPTDNKDNRIFKQLSIEILHYFSFLSIRDYKTELLAKELKIPFVSTVDTAFLDSPAVEIPYEIKMAIGNSPYMVFVPNYLLWHYAYKNKATHATIIDFYCEVMNIIWGSNPELNIVMLPQIFGRDDNYLLSDVRLFRELAQRKDDKRIIVISDNYSSDVQQSIIRDANYVIGARYHSIVFAINQGVPCIALSYEHKIEGLLMSLNKQAFSINIAKTFDSSDNFYDTLESIKRLIPVMKNESETVSLAKVKAMDCMDNFVEYIDEIK